MARRGLTGQLNIFDLYNSLDAGEVEMVSLVPEFEEEQEPVEEPEHVEEPEPVEEITQEVVTNEKVSMSRSYVIDGMHVEIAYINYNKVRITRGSEPPCIKEFASTKEAVDYYVEQMQELESDE